MDPRFFSHLLQDLQKVEYMCSFHEVVPRLIICHLLQPVVRLLLRLVAAAVVFVVAAAAVSAVVLVIFVVPRLPQICLQYH